MLVARSGVIRAYGSESEDNMTLMLDSSGLMVQRNLMHMGGLMFLSMIWESIYSSNTDNILDNLKESMLWISYKYKDV